MDASHLHLVAAAAGASENITALAMIHDDYGTHAADAQELFELIRKEFVSMYENNDPIADFAKKYPCVAPPPAKGSLDITEVLRSDFFFS
jgi:DNA-directed RNA polymerase